MSGDPKTLSMAVVDGIAKQKLHVILIVDTSRSMAGKRIGQVNAAISDIRDYLVELQSENSNVDFYVSIMTFSNNAEFLSGYKCVNVNQMLPPTLKAGGYSNLHCAYQKLTPELQRESRGGMMPDFGGIAPIILLITDGHPTKSSEAQLKELRALPWFRSSLRYGIAIELNDARTMRVLTDFTEDKDCVIDCVDSNTLAKIIQVIVLTASRVKSQSSAVRINRFPKGARGIVNQNNAHIVVKQQVKVTLDEIDDWEW